MRRARFRAIKGTDESRIISSSYLIITCWMSVEAAEAEVLRCLGSMWSDSETLTFWHSDIPQRNSTQPSTTCPGTPSYHTSNSYISGNSGRLLTLSSHTRRLETVEVKIRTILHAHPATPWTTERINQSCQRRYKFGKCAEDFDKSSWFTHPSCLMWTLPFLVRTISATTCS